MIAFNEPFILGSELDSIAEAICSKRLSGDGIYTYKCNNLLRELTNAKEVLLTHSCTSAIEMAALLAEIKPGDEVIMPSFTFVSTANAFVLRGAIPVFVDIRPDTMNLDENKIVKAINEKTKAIVPVHYAGISCEMNSIIEIAREYKLLIIEDAAQGYGSTYHGKPLGSMGQFGALSFHETKNIISGEGGALLLNDEKYIDRAKIIREKGTNRTNFLNGEVDKYTWVDIGSSFLPSELVAAFLFKQLDSADSILEIRREIWDEYYKAFNEPRLTDHIKLPVIPEDVIGNGHIFYIRLKDFSERQKFILKMKEKGVACTFHYLPLHNSPAGMKYGRPDGLLSNTEEVAETLVRLPIYPGMRRKQEQIISAAYESILGKSFF